MAFHLQAWHKETALALALQPGHCGAAVDRHPWAVRQIRASGLCQPQCLPAAPGPLRVHELHCAMLLECFLFACFSGGVIFRGLVPSGSTHSVASWQA